MPRHLPLAALLLLLAAAAPSAPLRPGLWRFTNTPGAATRDGRALNELPVGPMTSETVCLTPTDAASPARWLARDLMGDCTLTRTGVAGGAVDIAGACPAPDQGQAPGSLRLTGRYTATSYDLAFATVAHGENGTMGFGGAMKGERVGDCPAS